MAHALIFDSGVGGLSVAAEIRQLMPDVSMTYAADDVFRPYGEKTEAELCARLPELLWVLAEAIQPDVIVIACNTASTTALEHIRAAVNVPVVGVVPAIKPAALLSQTKTIGVLGTPGTVRREYVDALIHEFASDCQVLLHGSTGLVALAEAKLIGEAVNEEAVEAELAPLMAQDKAGKMDAVVLACTHFPLLRDELRRAAPKGVEWIDSGLAVAKYTQTVLHKNGTNISRPKEPDTALLIGPPPSKERKAAFAAYGFVRVVGLVG
ncbi:MAG: glutamate racemase [Alphaproteobacteria bacterium]